MEGDGDSFSLDISGYIDTICVYRCLICGRITSDDQKIIIHILSEHVQKVPVNLSADDTNLTCNASLEHSQVYNGSASSSDTHLDMQTYNVNNIALLQTQQSNEDQSEFNENVSSSSKHVLLTKELFLPTTQSLTCAASNIAVNCDTGLLCYSTCSTNEVENNLKTCNSINVKIETAQETNIARNGLYCIKNTTESQDFNADAPIVFSNNDIIYSGVECGETVSNSFSVRNSSSITSVPEEAIPTLARKNQEKFNQITQNGVENISLNSEVLAKCNTGSLNVDTLPVKSSIGIQVQLFKKPGRKRKLHPSNIESKDACEGELNMERCEKLTVASNNLESGLNSTNAEDRNNSENIICGHNRKRLPGKRRIKPPEVFSNGCFDTAPHRITSLKQECSDKPFVCPITKCAERFSSEDILRYHIPCHSTIPLADQANAEILLQGFSCPDCKTNFRTWKLMRRHAWRQHTFDAGMLCCTVCQFRTDTVQALRVHKEIHSSDKPYRCTVCGHGFRQHSQLLNHTAIHVRDHKINSDSCEKGQNICKICSRCFANKKSLKNHIETVHDRMKSYLCTHCGHTTSRKGLLQLHLRTHTGEKPYKCQLCSYTSGDHNSLRRHMMRHSGQRPYNCQYCSYSCIQAISLKLHLTSKHSDCDSLYRCTVCNYHTVNHNNWLAHQQWHVNQSIT